MRQLRLALTAGLCMGAVLLCALISHVAVPLYDGVGFPDEPYRYVSPPSEETRTPKKPGIAETTVPLTSGTNASDLALSTRESGPQMLLYFPAHSLSAEAGSVRITATPYAPAKGQSVSNKALTGNYYHVRFAASQGDAHFTQPATAIAYIQLRLPQGFPLGGTILYRTADGSTWRTTGTVRTGSDVYQATFVGPGDYILASTPARSPANYTAVAIAGTFAAILGIAALLMVIRRHSEQPAPKPRASKR
ncbi:MAG TPA: hypothetical protein VLF59_01440 [Candidatus Saccharimonadales bacterium]|nr:hypothetical protein [Candidatus Saccharimonadales bacterium]